MPRFSLQKITQNPTWLSVGFLMILSYFTFVHGYWNPPALFWDENYHIASAQKYINGVFFMEPHPPLGKLMIAAGEVLLNRNPLDNQFIGTDYATNPPAGFSFAGYRLFPVVLAWLTVPLIFGIFWLITRRDMWALLLSFMYVFDNALIVHSRSAMLESTLLFFGALTIFAYLLLREWKDKPNLFRWASILFGIGFACALATKAFALLFILFIPVIAWIFRSELKKCGKFLLYAGIAFAVFYIGIWHIHFSRATSIVASLPDAGYYQASSEYKSILRNGKNASLFAFPYMLRDSIQFVSHYQKGVPSLDLCKADENGSPWFLWPFGGRTINYRWETDGNVYRYMYLQSNPVVWFTGLAGIILTFALLVGSVLFPEGVKLKNRFNMTVFLGFYVSFMVAVSRIDRVMYLYHYFLPLIFSFILFGYVFNELQNFGKFKLDEQRKTSILLVLAVCIFASFQFFRPLSYYEPLTDNAFSMRSWLKVWELHCVRCDSPSPFVVPTK